MPKRYEPYGRPNRFYPASLGQPQPGERATKATPVREPQRAAQPLPMVELMRYGHAKLSERMHLFRAERAPHLQGPHADSFIDRLFDGAMHGLEAFVRSQPRTEADVTQWIEQNLIVDMQARQEWPQPGPVRPRRSPPAERQASPALRSASLPAVDVLDRDTNALELVGMRPAAAERTATWSYGVPLPHAPWSPQAGSGAAGPVLSPPMRGHDSAGAAGPVSAPPARSHDSSGPRSLTSPVSTISSLERADGQPAILCLEHLLRHLGLDDPRWQEPACAGVRAMLEAVPEHHRLSYRQALRRFLAPLPSFEDRVAALGAFGHLGPHDMMGLGRAMAAWLPDMGQLPPQMRLTAVQTAIQAFEPIAGPERFGVAYAARLQNLAALPLHQWQRAVTSLDAVPKSDRLEVALLSAQLCHEAFDGESLCAVVDALKAIPSQKRLHVAEAVKQCMVRGSSGAMVARMLMATASVTPDAVLDFAGLMLEVRDVALRAVQKGFSAHAAMLPPYHATSGPQRSSPLQSQRTDALITCVVQACGILAAMDVGPQLDLVSFTPRLLGVCADHEQFIAWMKGLAQRPKDNWEEFFSRFGKLQEKWGNAASNAHAWEFFTRFIQDMDQHKYKNYLRAFNQIDRTERASGDRVALLVALTRIQDRDMPHFIYTINALQGAEMTGGEMFQGLVNALSKQPREAWDDFLEAFDELSNRYSGPELASEVLALARKPYKPAQGLSAQPQAEPSHA